MGEFSLAGNARPGLVAAHLAQFISHGSAKREISPDLLSNIAEKPVAFPLQLAFFGLYGNRQRGITLPGAGKIDVPPLGQWRGYSGVGTGVERFGVYGLRLQIMRPGFLAMLLASGRQL
ncbi:hypothetical protein ACQKDL_01990 [Pseudomonas bubulae]|uniref:hypothetical protein n=1 Tax=Pseudomonas bubulae TaxID=2316085 RepID=UPI003D05FEC8